MYVKVQEKAKLYLMKKIEQMLGVNDIKSSENKVRMQMIYDQTNDVIYKMELVVTKKVGSYM